MSKHATPVQRLAARAREEERRQKAEQMLDRWFENLILRDRPDVKFFCGGVAALTEFEILSPAESAKWVDRVREVWPKP